MARPRTGGRRRHSGGTERAAALVEFALILPLFLMIVLGLFTGGIAYNRKISLTHAAREASRYGATLPVSNFAGYTTVSNPSGALDKWLDEVASVAVDSAGGELEPTDSGRVLCVAYVYPDGTADNDRDRARRATTGGPAYDGTPCIANDGRPTNERRVQVVVERTADLNAFAFTRVLTLKSSSLTRFESAVTA